MNPIQNRLLNMIPFIPIPLLFPNLFVIIDDYDYDDYYYYYFFFLLGTPTCKNGSNTSDGYVSTQVRNISALGLEWGAHNAPPPLKL